MSCAIEGVGGQTGPQVLAQACEILVGSDLACEVIVRGRQAPLAELEE
jgi:hypothetical protein